MRQIADSTTTKSDVIIDLVFLPTGKTWQPKPNTNGRFIESGEHLVRHLVQAINTAQTMICFTSFIFQKGEIVDALEKAAERGVKVFVLTSDIRVTQQKIYDIGNEQKAVKGFKDLLNQQMRYKALVRMANNIHAKYILIDPKGENAKGFLATCNFTEKATKENPELVVVLNKKETLELFKNFVWHFWEATTDEQDAKDIKQIEEIQRFPIPELLTVLQTSTKANQYSLRRYCLDIIQSAKSKITFSTFGFDISHELGKALLKKCKEGITVEIFARNRLKSIVGHLDKLAKAGAKIFTHNLLHAKFLIVDEEKGAIFTANFEKHGMDEGMEVGLKLAKSDVVELKNIVERWQNTFSYYIKANMPLIKLPNNFFLIQQKGLQLQTIESEMQKQSTIKPQNFNEVIREWSKKNDFDKKKIKKYHFGLSLSLEEKSIDALIKEKELTSNIYLGEYHIEKKQRKNNKSKQIIKKAILITEGVNFDNFSKFEEYGNLPIFALKI